jgi:hypothetical protein
VIALLLLSVIPRLFDASAPDLSEYQTVPPPGIEMRRSEASATNVPWIDANGWRFQRGISKALYADLPEGRAPLAAAEAFAYGVDAILKPHPADAERLKAMFEFLAKVEAAPLPVLANVGLIDDKTDEFGEVLNMLGRRNLAYRVVQKPDPKLDLTIRIGSKDFPRDSVENPNDFAARVREKVTDDKRLVRLFGTYTVLAHLTGDGKRARLHLLNYSRRPVEDVRVRVLGPYKSVRLAEAHDPEQHAVDIAPEARAIEFTVPRITTYAVVDLTLTK